MTIFARINKKTFTNTYYFFNNVHTPQTKQFIESISWRLQPWGDEQWISASFFSLETSKKVKKNGQDL